MLPTPTRQGARSKAHRIARAALGALIAASCLSAAVPAARADTSAGNWGQQAPAQSPAGRAYPSMAYDSGRGRTVLFGGGSGCCAIYGDTWEWDGSRWAQVATTPGAVAGTRYGLRAHAA